MKLSRRLAFLNPISLSFLMSLGVIYLILGSFWALAEDAQRSVNLDWEPIPGALKYEIRLQEKLKYSKKKKPEIYTVKKASWSAVVNFGKYNLQLRTFDDRGAPGSWSPPMEILVKPFTPQIIAPKNRARFKSQNDDQEEVSFEWKDTAGADRYILRIQSNGSPDPKEIKVTQTHHKLKLDVAQNYSWSVQAIMTDGTPGDLAEKMNQFKIYGKQLAPPRVDPPLSKFVKELTWSAPEFASSYSYALYHKTKSDKWKRIESKKRIPQNQVGFNLANPTGEYKISVRANGKNRRSSEVSHHIFKVKGGLRTPAAIDAAILKDSLSKPTHFYGIASYFVTQVNYKNINKETNNASTFEELGGTGRIGLGYQDPFHWWGAYGVIDLSGINIGGENQTFAAAEIHGTWKWANPSSNLFLVSGGLYMKELPEIVGSQANGLGAVEKAKNMGPHLGFKVWMPLSQKIGVQFNARAYYSLLGEAPNGQEVTPTLSYQAGALGSLRLAKNLMGFAGYAYRLDQTQFNADFEKSGSFASPGDVNIIEIQGHYLNLILEYSF